MAIKKVATAGGHSKKAPGASCYIDEYAEDRKCNKAFVSALKARGVAAKDCSNEYSPASKELARECALANAYGGDLFVTWHFNAASKTSGKRGVEVWYYTGSKTGKTYAEKISKKLASLMGLPNRGAKATTGLYVLRHTKAPAILIEVCFVDAKGDANAYKSVGASKVAAAVADVLMGKTAAATDSKPATSKPTTSKPTTSKPAASKAGLTVDGLWGKSTTKALQKVLGTTADGIVSNQYSAYKALSPGLLSQSWQWRAKPSGLSPMVKAMQKRLGVTADGHIGPKTIKALQKRMGTTVDGYISKPSPCVKELQKRINSGKF